MSPIGSENFYKLEEFSSFISCIKCFGRPIIPPLLTPSRRHELQQLRIAAINKEAEKLRIRNELLNCQKQDTDISSMTCEDDCRAGFHPTVQKSCALWYPSVKDQEGISVAISKFPTSGIYSSVHTGAIVCSNVIENSHAYNTTIMRDSLLDPGTNVIDCIECSHNNINLECSLCQEEYNQSFHNKNFASDPSPEVPCRIVSLLQQNIRDPKDDESNYAVEETESESLPTVIYNQKCVLPDTDSESNITSMTQSTDLEKYMEFSCEFNSPDNSATLWDSKSVSQQYTLSRSDDASSETIVNTENELTPCASTMAELTDNIEDEFSNTDEIAAVSDKEVISGTLKRAHSVDSYMKILQSCAKSMNVKKSLSEPFNTGLKTASSYEVAPLSLKTSLLIKEDSKESDESKDIPEKDVPDQVNNKDVLLKGEESPNTKSNDISFQKKHIRQNSYTLDEPSSALILAHADCTCNFDVNCISPHSSALNDEIISNFAFTKEKVVVDIPVSHQQMKKLPILSSSNSSENETLVKVGMTSTVIDVFPVVKEDVCEKSDSANAELSGTISILESQSTSEVNRDAKTDEENDMISESFNSFDDKSRDYYEHIYQELQERYRLRVNKVFEEQNKMWLNLQEEFKEQERFLREKLKLPIADSLPKAEEKQQIRNNDCSNGGKIVDNKSVDDGKELELSISNNSIFSSDQNSTSDKTLTQNSVLSVATENYQFAHSPSKNLSLPQNARASIFPSTEFKTSNISPSKPLENINNKQLSKDSVTSTSCSVKSNEDLKYTHCSELIHSINGFPCTTTSILLPQCNNSPQSPRAIAVPFSKKCDVCFCDNPVEQCKCCTSFNGYCEFDVNNSQSEYTPPSLEQNSISDTKVLNSDISFSYSSASTDIQGKNFNYRDFRNSHKNNPPKKVPCSSRNSIDLITATNNVMPSTSNDLGISNAVSYEDKNKLPESLSGKCKISVDNIVSLCAKTLNNGSVSQAAVNKRLINDPVLLKKFEKLPAFVKGYLTRRLFKTERVQNLIKTLQDTIFLFGKLDEDLSMKGDSVSERDVDFRRQLMVQLMTTFQNIYDTFCTISTKERMAIISESRNLRLKQKTLDQRPQLIPPVTIKAAEPAPYKKHKLSSATLKALERKRSSNLDSRTSTVGNFRNTRSRSTIEMRTYTIDDLPNFRGRTHSSLSSKSLSVSPSSIYKTSVCMKKKNANSKSSGARRSLHNRFVP